ncbi:MAG: hypothetical protein ACT4QD_07670 [Acidobacteriota bacterium]
MRVAPLAAGQPRVVAGRLAIGLAGVAMLAACAARAPARPVGPPMPDQSALDAFAQATRPCVGLRTVTGELRLTGRAGTDKIRGTLHAGLAAPASIRFEAVAPFGPPVFILAGQNDRATLLFPRDSRVLADAAVPQVLERLTGIALSAQDVRLILTSCLSDSPPQEGRSWSGGWQAVTLDAGVTAYLKRVDAAPAVVAADFRSWRVDYADHLAGRPRLVRIRSADDGRVDLTARLAQVNINTGISDRAFVVDVPPDAVPLTLEELRAVAPLKGSD